MGILHKYLTAEFSLALSAKDNFASRSLDAFLIDKLNEWKDKNNIPLKDAELLNLLLLNFLTEATNDPELRKIEQEMGHIKPSVHKTIMYLTQRKRHADRD